MSSFIETTTGKFAEENANQSHAVRLPSLFTVLCAHQDTQASSHPVIVPRRNRGRDTVDILEARE
jgi:hypothetical protein